MEKESISRWDTLQPVDKTRACVKFWTEYDFGNRSANTSLSLPVLLLPQVVKRGMAPGGGGEVVFTCPVRRTIRPVQLTDPGKIKRIRGVAYPSLCHWQLEFKQDKTIASYMRVSLKTARKCPRQNEVMDSPISHLWHWSKIKSLKCGKNCRKITTIFENLQWCQWIT